MAPQAEWLVTTESVRCESPDHITALEDLVACWWWCVEGDGGGMVSKEVQFVHSSASGWYVLTEVEGEDWCSEW